MRPITVSVGPLAAASANNIALTQTPTAALTLNGALVVGGVAIMDKPRRVLITTTGNESAKTFTIVGTNSSGSSISEVLAGPNISTGQSVLDYATVTSITISSAAAAALTVGTSGVASSAWVNLDPWALPQVGIQCTASGTVNYTVQESYDDPTSPTNPVTPANMTWASSLDAAVVGATATQVSSFTYAPIWTRVLLNSGAGTVTATFNQSGVVPL